MVSRTRSIPATRWTRTFTTYRRRSKRRSDGQPQPARSDRGLGSRSRLPDPGRRVPEDLIEDTWNSNGKKSTISSTHRIRWNSRCITASRTHLRQPSKGCLRAALFSFRFSASVTSAVVLGLRSCFFILNRIITFLHTSGIVDGSIDMEKQIFVDIRRSQNAGTQNFTAGSDHFHWPT